VTGEKVAVSEVVDLSKGLRRENRLRTGSTANRGSKEHAALVVEEVHLRKRIENACGRGSTRV
jgi:hypothetical protein